MASLSEIVGTGVYNNGTSDDALSADQLDELICDGAFGDSLAVCLDVAQVSDVAFAVFWCTMLLVLWVDWGERQR